MASLRAHTTGLKQMVAATESKSVALELHRFETCREQSFFSFRTHVEDTIMDSSSGGHLNCSQPSGYQSQNLFLVD
jgi:hypothetical protein